MKYIFFIASAILLLACNNDDAAVPLESVETALILGADLSYLNEMMDCGAEFNSRGSIVNPYDLFADEECQMVRLRLWHTPSFNQYSGLEDVLRAAEEIKQRNMDILLDFHYSDSWADPGQQIIPAAWLSVEDDSVLADSVYKYTQKVLSAFLQKDITPSIVQVGNEINSEVLQKTEVQDGQKINWQRNVLLLNSGLQAIQDFNQQNQLGIQTMLHIAQPENVSWWFKEAEENGIAAHEWIGISYYPQWSKISLSGLSQELIAIKTQFSKKVMIVETAYPHSLENLDAANNILGNDAALSEYGVSPAAQLQYLNELKKVVLEGGSDGVLYWEPAWVSTGCTTLWGTGSHWENATFFDPTDHEALEAFSFFNAN